MLQTCFTIFLIALFVFSYKDKNVTEESAKKAGLLTLAFLLLYLAYKYLLKSLLILIGGIVLVALFIKASAELERKK